MISANWIFSAKIVTRIRNAIAISICANANLNMWFNLSTMANLGVSVSRLPTPYVMHNFGMYSECSFVMPDQKPIFSIENKFQDLQVRRRIWELDRMSIQLCSPLWVLLSSCSSSCASSYNSLPSMIQSPNPQSKQQKTLQIFFS